MNKFLHFNKGIIALVALAWLGISCSSDDTTEESVGQDVIDQGIIAAYLEADSSIEAQFDEESGIHIIIEKENPGGQSIAAGDIVEAFYEIKSLETGIVIDIKDAIRGTGKMRFGEDAIYPIGFDQALSFMKLGEEYRFLVPSSMGYGDIEVVGLIAPNDVLDITISVENILTDEQQLAVDKQDIDDYIIDNNISDIAITTGGVYLKKTLELDSGGLAGIGENVEITFLGTFLDGEPFDGTFGSETFPFEFGSGQVILGLDVGVGELFFGESAIIIIPSELGYSGSAHVMPPLIRQELVSRKVIPTYAAIVGSFEPLVFELTLLP
jgi:FKBP-type peptidyl-prolyl cis-trans isomerase